MIPENVDIVITRGPPKYILDRADDNASDPAAGCEHLRRATMRTKPLLHAFGHVHKGYGAQRVDWDADAEDGMAELPKEFVGKNSAKKKGFAAVRSAGVEKGEQTVFVNAAIMGGDDELNALWVVDLTLPIAAAETKGVKRKAEVLEKAGKKAAVM